MTNKNKYLKYKYKYFNLKNKLNSYIGGFPNEGSIVYDMTGLKIGTITGMDTDFYILDSETSIPIQYKDKDKTWRFETFEEKISILLDEIEDLKYKRSSIPKENTEEREALLQKKDDKLKIIDILTETHRQNILNQYTGCPGNSIIIGNFEFSLMAYDPIAYGNRGILIIKSTNRTTGLPKLFAVYSSKSECGFWRLCIATKKDVLIKGNPSTMDYIQGTFVHIELQKFIDSNLCNCANVEIGNKCFFMDNIEDAYIYKHVTKSERGIKISPFYEYTQVDGNRTGYRSRNTELIIHSNLLTLSKLLRAEFISPNFSIDSEYHKTIVIDDNTLIIDGTIIRCIFINGIILYMLQFSLTVVHKDGTSHVKEGICPIIMISNKSEITEFGLYSEFIPAGNYIGKLFEYSNQITGDIHEPLKLGKDYVYIGHRYDGIYPYTEYHF
jgi:hypothetical protein